MVHGVFIAHIVGNTMVHRMACLVEQDRALQSCDQARVLTP